MNIIPGIRNAVRAVIRREGSILVQHKRYQDGTERYTLPGGAPEGGETLIDGLRRECLEEIGVDVEVAALLHVADFYKRRDTVPPTYRQQVEFLFDCNIPGTYQPGNGPQPDKHQIGVLWLPIADLCDHKFFPKGFLPYLQGTVSDAPLYLGRID